MTGAWPRAPDQRAAEHHASTAFNVDENGYLLVTQAASSQIVAQAKTVTDATASTPIPQNPSGVPTSLVARRRVHLRNFNNPDTEFAHVWVGGRDVTTSIGYPIPPYEELALDVTDAIQLYAIVETDKPVDLRSLELA